MADAARKKRLGGGNRRSAERKGKRVSDEFVDMHGVIRQIFVEEQFVDFSDIGGPIPPVMRGVQTHQPKP